MRVLSVEPLDKRRKKIVLEDGTMFALYGGEIRRYRLMEGEDCSEELYATLLEEVLCKRARERLLYLLKNSDKTEAEVRRKLKDGYYPDLAVEHAVGFARRYGYVDDGRYARAYLQSGKKRKSRRQMVYELQQKGIDRELLKEILEEEPEDEEEAIRRYLNRKRICWEDPDPVQLLKHKQALLRKGYSYEAVNRVISGRRED